MKKPLLTLDPRCKLYLLLLGNLLLFFHVDLKAEIAVMFFLLLPFYLDGKSTLKGIRLTMTYIVLLLADVFLIPVAQGLAASLISFFAVGIRMMLPCLVSGAYAFTSTTVSAFVCALRKMHVPEAIVIPCMVVIRFFPTLREDYRQIRHSMQLRGVGGNFLGTVRNPMRSLEYVVIPLLMNSNNVAQDLSVAALTKGLGIQSEHTSLTEIRFGFPDGLYMALSTLPLVISILEKTLL